MLHQTSIPWSPARMRRLIFSLICSSGNPANVLKPTNVGIPSSQIRILYPAHSEPLRSFAKPRNKAITDQDGNTTVQPHGATGPGRPSRNGAHAFLSFNQAGASNGKGRIEVAEHRCR